MRRVRKSTFSIRKLKVIFTIFIFIILSFIINSYFKKGQKDIQINQSNIKTMKTQDIFPIYQGSKLSLSMSQTGDPFIYVFLTKDKYKKVVDFYREALAGKYKLKIINYKRMMTIYQFRSITDDLKIKAEEKLKRDKFKDRDFKILDDYITKGVEIIPLNHLWERAVQAKTKIKIIIPRKILFKKEKNIPNKETKD